MKTQSIDLPEAINFALADHACTSYKNDYTLYLKKGMLAVKHPSFPKGKMIDSYLVEAIKDEKWTAGDDRSITGYYKEK